MRACIVCEKLTRGEFNQLLYYLPISSIRLFGMEFFFCFSFSFTFAFGNERRTRCSLITTSFVMKGFMMKFFIFWWVNRFIDDRPTMAMMRDWAKLKVIFKNRLRKFWAIVLWLRWRWRRVLIGDLCKCQCVIVWTWTGCGWCWWQDVLHMLVWWSITCIVRIINNKFTTKSCAPEPPF